jgi:hypothetical protein
MTAGMEETRERERPRARRNDEVEEDVEAVGTRHWYLEAVQRNYRSRILLEAMVYNGKLSLERGGN